MEIVEIVGPVQEKRTHLLEFNFAFAFVNFVVVRIKKKMVV